MNHHLGHIQDRRAGYTVLIEQQHPVGSFAPYHPLSDHFYQCLSIFDPRWIGLEPLVVCKIRMICGLTKAHELTVVADRQNHVTV